MSSAVVATLALSACSPRGLEAEHYIAATITDDIACENRSAKIFGALFKAVENDEAIPSLERMKSRFEENLLTDYPDLSGEQRETLLAQLEELYRTLESDSGQVYRPEDGFPLSRRIAALELGFDSTPEQKALKQRLQKSFSQLTLSAQAAGVECSQGSETPPEAEDPPVDSSPPPPPSNPVEPEENPYTLSSTPAHKGALRVFGVIHQSCASLEVAPLTLNSPSVQGITRTGTRPDGGGIRIVSDASAVMRTNPFLKVHSPGGSCRSLRSTPPIYDFGGKPGVTGNAMDMFKNGGDGTSALGIDCSGFVSAALLNSGLKLSSSAPIRPSQSGAYSSRQFKRPGSDGLDCLAKVKVTASESVKSGDILAMDGHVVMLEVFSEDPLGLDGISRVEDCRSGPVASSKFDFLVIQSSSSKNGIGMNRYRAKDYFQENASFKEAMLQYAVAACKARFSGQSSTPSPSGAILSRHTGTSACRAAEVPLVGQECVQSCF